MPTLTPDDGAVLKYQDDGNERGKPPLIFLHGWCSNLNHWDNQVVAFQEEHRILRIDRRGMGLSTSPGTGHTPEQEAADAAAIARHEGFSDAVMIAHAGGSPVGIYFSHIYPELAKAYVMVDATVGPAANLDDLSDTPDQPLTALFREMMDNLAAPDGEAYFRGLYRSFFGAQADPAMVDSIVEDACRTPADVRIKEVRVIASDTATQAGECCWCAAA